MNNPERRRVAPALRSGASPLDPPPPPAPSKVLPSDPAPVTADTPAAEQPAAAKPARRAVPAAPATPESE